MPWPPAIESQRRRLIEIIADRGLRRLETPVRLASGAMSAEFIDGKLALCAAQDLRLAADLIVKVAAEHGIHWEAVGGLTMGADALAVATALEADKQWFLVRKETKDRGTRRLIEGTPLRSGNGAIVVDDVITTGGSVVKAIDAVSAVGAEVRLVTTLVDRGETCGEVLAEREIPYLPLMTYRDLGIPPVVGPESPITSHQ